MANKAELFIRIDGEPIDLVTYIGELQDRLAQQSDAYSKSTSDWIAMMKAKEQTIEDLRDSTVYVTSSLTKLVTAKDRKILLLRNAMFTIITRATHPDDEIDSDAPLKGIAGVAQQALDETKEKGGDGDLPQDRREWVPK